MTAVSDYAVSHTAQAVSLLKALAPIPAPSGNEERRATFCRDWLHAHGATQAYIDEVQNVICPIGVTSDNPLTVICAHSDVVFADTEPLPLEERDGRLYCPGIGDDTANVVALLMAVKYCIENAVEPRVGLLFVVNSCEEGLGNLKGTKHLMSVFGSRVREFVSFDCSAREVIAQAVGSRRFRICADTAGGHSYFDFGADNAVAVLSSLVTELYRMTVPASGTTFNVGTISGGTSVNTIAQHAEMLFEFRSDNDVHLERMQEQFDSIVSRYPQVTAETVGERPCAKQVDADAQAALVAKATETIRSCFGWDPVVKAGSTDCNVPLSMGIPSVCFGCILGNGMHTREEYIELNSVTNGLQAALKTVMHYEKKSYG
ncbi:MAG: M20/M25/M40 family metallo-hydrolase [Ruminococcaceae bacterium]|nr:M20/M25/M40 family metallo-hydrolase [Oscillospiraceae bacterium]